MMTNEEPTGTGSVFFNKSRDAWKAQVYYRDEHGRRRRKVQSYATEQQARAGLAELRAAFDVKPGAMRNPQPAVARRTTVFFDRSRAGRGVKPWVGQLKGEDGRTRTVTRATEREARDALAELVASVEEDRPVVPSGTLREWLAFYAAEVLPTEGLAPDTVAGVRGYIERELLPSSLAALRLDDLTALDVHRYLSGLVGVRGATTVKQIRNALSKALKSAVLYGRLSPNVTEALKGQRLPHRDRTGRKRKVKMLTEQQARGLLAAAEAEGFGPMVTVMLGTGLRRGEVLALRWDHIDFEAGTMRYEAAIAGDGAGGEVYGPTKTGVEELDVLAPVVLDALRRQRAAQAAVRLAYRWPWAEGDEYDDFVFTNPIGRRYKADYVTKRITKIAREAGLGHITPHMLRHSAASFLAAAGAPVAVIQRVLHHASEDITKDVYIHLLSAAYEEGTEALDAVLRMLASGE